MISNVLGQNLGKLKSGKHDEKFYDELWDTISSGKIWSGQIINRRKDGTLYHDEATIFPIIDEKGKIINYASFQRDITEQIKMRELMIRNEKMLSIGDLAAGMAHEINNPLAGKIQSAEVIANRLGLKEISLNNIKEAKKSGTSIESIKSYMEARDIFRMINSIQKSGKKVATIVENMINFSQSGKMEKSLYNIANLLEKTIEIAENDFELKNQYTFKSIKLIKSYDNDIPPVHCEGSKIQQVFLNILRNGAQAMQDAEIVNPQLILKISYEKETNMVLIEIEDNGPGMSAGVERRIFEPFFTTKSVGSGTGLGLSVSFFIVNDEHNGEMSVESGLGRGTTISVRLPL